MTNGLSWTQIKVKPKLKLKQVQNNENNLKPK